MPTEKFILQGEDRTGAAFRSVRAGISGLQSQLAGLAGALGVGAFAGMVKASIDAGDALQKMAIRSGASTEALSQLSHAAKLSGTEIGAVAKGMQQMQRSAVEAADGTKSYADAYARLGIDVAAFLRLKPEDQLEVMADALSGVKNEAERTALVMETMGRSGTELLPMLSGGAAGLREMRAEADALGLTLTRAAADDMARANDALQRISTAVTGFGRQLAVISAGPLGDFLEGISMLARLATGGGTHLEELNAEFERLDGVIADLETDIADATGQGAFGAMSKWMAEQAGVNVPALQQALEITRQKQDALMLAMGNIVTAGPEINATVDNVTGAVTRLGEATKLTADQLKQVLVGVPTEPDFGPDPTGEGYNADRKNMLAEEMEALRTRYASELELLTLFQEEKRALVQEAFEADLLSAEERNSLLEQMEADHQSRLLGIKTEAIDAEAQAQSAALNGIIGLMGMFAGKSKAIALAMLIFEKGKAIADVLIQTQVAAARALAELGPVAGPPMAAKILAWGKISAGVIAATGIAQAGGGGGGGGGIGGSASGRGGFLDRRNDAGAGAGAAQVARVITINLGDDAGILPVKAVRNLIAQINEATDDGVRIFVGSEAVA